MNTPTAKRRPLSKLAPLIEAQLRRITKHGYLIKSLREGVDEARLDGAKGVEDLATFERCLDGALGQLAVLERHLSDLQAELDR